VISIIRGAGIDAPGRYGGGNLAARCRRTQGRGNAISYDGLIVCGHDALLVSAARAAILDKQRWPGTEESGVVERGDVLEKIDAGDW
jgi:hypothetical protein